MCFNNIMALSCNETSDVTTVTTHVNYVCQKCRKPLKMSNTFSNLTSDTIAELSGMMHWENK